jgi:hypothetical protein
LLKKVEAPKDCFKGLTMISGSVFTHIKHILLALEKNAFLGHSKPTSPNTEHSPHWSGLPTSSPHQHHRMEEDSHLHTTDIQEQSLSDYAQQDLSIVTKKIIN